MGIYGNGGKYVYLPYDTTILQIIDKTYPR